MYARRVGEPQSPPVAWLFITALIADKRETAQALAHLALEVPSHKTTQIRVFLVLGPSGAASHVVLFFAQTLLMSRIHSLRWKTQ